MKKKYYTGMGTGPKNAQLQDESLVSAKKNIFPGMAHQENIIKNIKKLQKTNPQNICWGGG